MFALVTGTGRCGSTAVHEVLARHPSVGFLSNVDDRLSVLNLSGRWNGALYRRMSPRDPHLRAFGDRRVFLERGRVRLAPSEAWNVIDRHAAPGFSRPCRDLVAADATPRATQRLQAFFDRRMSVQNSPVFLHKLTGWPRTGLLQVAYPQLKVINVVRDGRAVANSWLQMGWWDGYRGPENWYLGPLSAEHQREWVAADRSFVALAALGWKVLMEAYEEARAVFPAGQWMDVRYEDMLAAPRDVVAEMLAFLGLEWSRSFEQGFRRHRLARSSGASLSHELGADNLITIDDILADVLARWGYEVPSRAA